MRRALVVLSAGLASVLYAGESKLWTKERIQECLKSLEEMKANGLISESHYTRKRKMLEERLKGTFKATALSQKREEKINLIQNGGFEEVNRNTRRDRSRWLWWGGWSWGGQYENFWAEAPNVHSGIYSAGIKCVGKRGRIGIFTPALPVIPGVKKYVFSIWAKGTPGNVLWIRFEGGVSGRKDGPVPEQWTQLVVEGRPLQGKKDFRVYLYAVGTGTIYLDDAKLEPVGIPAEEFK